MSDSEEEHESQQALPTTLRQSFSHSNSSNESPNISQLTFNLSENPMSNPDISMKKLKFETECLKSSVKDQQYIRATLLKEDKTIQNIKNKIIKPMDKSDSSSLLESNPSKSFDNSHLPTCKYGTDCYRKNPAHFREFSHAIKNNVAVKTGCIGQKRPLPTSTSNRNSPTAETGSAGTSITPSIKRFKNKMPDSVDEEITASESLSDSKLFVSSPSTEPGPL